MLAGKAADVKIGASTGVSPEVLGWMPLGGAYMGVWVRSTSPGVMKCPLPWKDQKGASTERTFPVQTFVTGFQVVLQWQSPTLTLLLGGLE